MNKKGIKDFFNIMMIKNSEFFDEKYYQFENPEITGNLVRHYYYTGYKEGRNPSEKFDNDYYLKIHKDVRDTNINPLVHYLKNGRKENRKIRSFKGLTINKIYRRLYKKLYFASIHLISSESKKVSLIVYDLNDKYIEIIKSLLNKLSVDRVVYLRGNSDELLSLSSLVKLEKYCSDYYLDVGYEDINICLDERSFILFNSSYYIDKFYFYTDNISGYSKEFICSLSYYATIGKVNILSSNKKLEIKGTVINNFDCLDEKESVIFVFESNFILGLEIINDYVLSHNINSEIKLFYESKDIHCKIWLDDGTVIMPFKDENVLRTVYFRDDEISIDGKAIVSFNKGKNINIDDINSISKNH